MNNNAEQHLVLWVNLRIGLRDLIDVTRRFMRNPIHDDLFPHYQPIGPEMEYVQGKLQECRCCPWMNVFLPTTGPAVSDVWSGLDDLLMYPGTDPQRFLNDALTIMPKVEAVVGELRQLHELNHSPATAAPKKRTPHNKGQKSALHQQIDLLAADGLTPGEIDQRVQGTNPQAITAYLYRERRKQRKKSDAR
jgi:hypothetical protein